MTAPVCSATTLILFSQRTSLQPQIFCHQHWHSSFLNPFQVGVWPITGISFREQINPSIFFHERQPGKLINLMTTAPKKDIPRIHVGYICILHSSTYTDNRPLTSLSHITVLFHYRPPTKLWEGNVFIGILSTEGWGISGQCPFDGLGYHWSYGPSRRG